MRRILPLVFNVFSNIIFNRSIFALHPVQFVPVESVLACSLLQCSRKTRLRPEWQIVIINYVYNYYYYFATTGLHSLRQQIKKIRQWRTFPFEVTRNRLAIIGRSQAQTCNEALVGYLPQTAVWLDRKWLRNDQSQRAAALAITPRNSRGPCCVQGRRDPEPQTRSEIR